MNNRNVLILCSGMVPDGIGFLAMAGWRLEVASEPAAARQLLHQQKFDAGLIHIPQDHAGLAAAETILVAERDIAWVALTEPESGEHPSIIRLISHYCVDFHTLPPDRNRFLHSLGHAAGMTKLARLLLANASVNASAPPPGDIRMVGSSPAMQAIFCDLGKVARSEAPVLIFGESGTGKELAARAIHERSSRARGPFVVVNCAAMPSTLIQSELFGYEKGAFTGASQRRLGSLELASGGVIFLDEIGDLPLEQQASLLRFLQEGTITRIGSAKEIPVDARVLAATHVDLEHAVEEGLFREDLYFRLNVLRLKMPPLRERRDDIPILAQHFFRRFAEEENCRLKGFSRCATDAMTAYKWPGNIRELINRMRRAVVMCETRQISSDDLGLDAPDQRTIVPRLAEVRALAEKATLQDALTASNGNLTEAARLLGISRPALYRLLDKYGQASVPSVTRFATLRQRRPHDNDTQAAFR